MNNVKAIAASGVMVMAAALGAGALIVWQQPPIAAPSQEPQVVVEYVDVPSAGTEPIAESSPSSVDEAPAAPEAVAPEPVGAEPAVALEEYAEHNDEHEGGEDDD